MPLDTTVITDTLRVGRRSWIHVTRVVHDTLWVPHPRTLASPPEPKYGWPPWLGYLITAVAAVIAGLLAQWFRVWLDHVVKRRHLVDELFTDFAVLERMTAVLANQYERAERIDHDNLAIVDFILKNFERLRLDLPLLRFEERASVLTFYRELTASRALLERGRAGELSRGEVDRLKFELRKTAERFGDSPNVLDRVKETYSRVMWPDVLWENSTKGVRDWFALRRMMRKARKLAQEDQDRT